MTEITENAESSDPSGVGTERMPLDGRTIGLDLLDRFGAAAVAGLAAGFLVGGLGGRMAMLLLRLTSSDAVIGIQSDDDFTIGQVTTSSFFLVLATTLIGTLLAFAYLLVRRWLPEHRRPLQAAVFFGVVGGAAVIKPGGVDFTLLDPLWLAVVLFIALPAAYGWAMAAMVEGLIARPGTYRKTRVAGIVFFVAIGFFGLFAAAIAVAGALLVLIGRQWPALAAAVTHPVVTWTVRIVLLVLVVVSGAELVSDVAEIL
ncbi:MAG: hypothetical protein ABW143_04240 [Acidimicrobiales bacterium]